MSFDMADIWTALELMLFGMGGVFLVLFILYLVSQALLKVFPATKK
ncbi:MULTISPECIES: OadG-related small transporter subunit [Enterococcus]|nr:MULTISPECIES: OadG-related small transporter subunit [Enterococcus]